MNREDIPTESLEKEIKKLLFECREALEKYHKTALACGRTIPQLTTLDNFEQVFKRLGTEQCIGPFEHFFNNNRKLILSVLSNDSFLRDGSLYIQMGVGTTLEKRMTKHKLQISSVYEACCFLREEAEKLSEQTDSDSFRGECKDLIRPNVILLHLIKILFYISTSSQDTDKLKKMIAELEVALDVPEENRLVKNIVSAETAINQGPTTAKAPQEDLGSMLSKFAPIFSTLMNASGVKAPIIPTDGQVLPNLVDLGSIGSVISHPSVTAAFGVLLNDIKKCEKPEDFLKTMLTSASTVLQTHVNPQYNQTTEGLLLPPQLKQTESGEISKKSE